MESAQTEGLGRMTSLVTDPDSVGHNSSPISVPVFLGDLKPIPKYDRVVS